MRLQLQSEASECGLACLSMIASHYVYQTTLSDLRQKFSVSLKGVTLGQLIRHASALNLSARPLRAELEEIPQLQLPCVGLRIGSNAFLLRDAVALHPIFDRPLKDISFGQVLLRLFQTSRRFNVEVQPQLVLLQKTMLNIEGLGRQLDPELDLWKTAKPYLERWMAEQVGWRGLFERLRDEVPRYAKIFPQLPRLAHQVLETRAHPVADLSALLALLLQEQRRMNRLMGLVAWLGGSAAVIVAGVQLYHRWPVKLWW